MQKLHKGNDFSLVVRLTNELIVLDNLLIELISPNGTIIKRRALNPADDIQNDDISENDSSSVLFLVHANETIDLLAGLYKLQVTQLSINTNFKGGLEEVSQSINAFVLVSKYSKTNIDKAEAIPELPPISPPDSAKMLAFLEQIEVTSSGDDSGVTFLNQISVIGESVAGFDSYPVPVAFHCDEVNTVGKTITGAINRTETFQSDSGSSAGMLGGVAAGKYLLVGSPNMFEGVKVKYEALATIEPQNVFAENYENDSSLWVQAPIMGTNSNYPYEAHGWNIAVHGHTSEQIFFGFNPLTRMEEPTWEKASFVINGITYEDFYWARYRIAQDITGDPIVQQIKLHTDRTEREAFGSFKFGKARSPLQLMNGIQNTIPNANIDPSDESVFYTPTFSGKYKDNEFQKNRNDGFGIIVNRKFGLDTSVPLVVEVSFYVKGTQTGDVEFSLRSSQVNDGYIYDGNNISSDSLILEPISEDSNLVRKTIYGLVPINELENNSAIIIELSRLASSSPNDTLSASVIITNIVVTGHQWKS